MRSACDSEYDWQAGFFSHTFQYVSSYSIQLSLVRYLNSVMMDSTLLFSSQVSHYYSIPISWVSKIVVPHH